MKIVINKERFIYLMIFLNPFFEIIYGLLYRMNIDLPINQLCRMVMFVSFWIMIANDKKSFSNVFLIVVCDTLIWMLQVAVGISRVSFDEIVFLIKLIYATSLPAIFLSLIRTKLIDKNKFINAIIYSTFVIVFSLCISPFGLGFRAWETNSYRTGYVGWFRFGNYLTATLLVSFCLILIDKTVRRRKVWIFFTIIALVLTGNKAALIGLVGYTVWISLYWLIHEKNKHANKFFMAIVVVFFPIVCLIGIFFVVDYVKNQIALYDAYGYKNLFTFLLSNRNLQVRSVVNSLRGEVFETWGKVIGYGFSNVINCIKYNNRGNSLEMDLYGLYYYVGLVPLVMWIFIYFRAIVNAFFNYKRNRSLGNWMLIIGLAIIVFHSVFSGHVIFESLTVVYAAALIAISNSNVSRRMKTIEEP